MKSSDLLSYALEGCEAIAQRLNESGSPAYLLLDGAQTPKVKAALRATGIARHESLFAETTEAAAAEAGPYLAVPVTGEPPGQILARMLRIIEVPFALSVLVSDLDFAGLSRRLTMRLDTVLPDAVQALLRFYDGRVVGHIAAVLSSEQRARMFSVASSWWHFDGDLRWKSLPCNFSATETLDGPLVLNEQQQNALIDACYPYSVIEHFAETDADLLDTVSLPERYAFFLHALSAARGYGIDGGAEAILFCTLALLRGRAFYRDAEWADRLEAVKAGRMSLRKAMQDFYAHPPE